ncbi:hypothetical protein HK096_003585 [Nowakowskiella sp. JEL0078]|nr:hypothetical protein HK096_003585 [Nowakowskiella sp. JEL0078]
MDVIGKSNEVYADLDYWDERYSNKLQPERGYLRLVQVLVSGCGNSTLSTEMYEDGFKIQTNIDYSEQVIQNMKIKFENSASEIRWIVADIFQLDEILPANSFDVAIDKGTMDAFLTKFKNVDDPWDPSAESLELARKYLTQVVKAIRPGGKFIHITWDQPHFRKMFLLSDLVKFERSYSVGDGFEYFIYVCSVL